MLLDFLHNLFNGQQVRVSYPQPIAEDARKAAVVFLAEFEGDYRIDLPGDPPAFDPEAAVWSATSFYTAATLLVYRDEGEEAIGMLLDSELPESSNAEAHYAVDLTMRFLPDLLKLAKSAATDDPLVVRLMEWATAWPLSSVGIEAVGQVNATPLRTSPTLMRLYADRIIAAGDHSRLDDPVVTEVVRVAMGDYPELCPSLAEKLETN